MHHRNALPLAAALLLALSSGACRRRPANPRLASVPVEAQDFFSSRCASCHGTDGSGNGPAAASLQPRPRNFGDPAWQAQTTDAQLREVIVAGGPAVGKSALMPANPDLAGRPELVRGLIALIRALGPATH